MKFIQKDKTSKSYNKLIELKRQNGTFEDLKNNKAMQIYLRDDILTSLLNEQGFLCAYCMQSIDINSATIEHIIGQNYKDSRYNGKDYQINYDNLLAVCQGKSCRNELHCDKSRANYQKNRLLFANPLKKQIVSNIKYTNNGVIYYKEYQEKHAIKKYKDHSQHNINQNIQYDLMYVLNLNCTNLKEERKAALNAIKKITKNWSDTKRITNLLDKHQTPTSTYYPFQEMLIYFLKKHI